MAKYCVLYCSDDKVLAVPHLLACSWNLVSAHFEFVFDSASYTLLKDPATLTPQTLLQMAPLGTHMDGTMN